MTCIVSSETVYPRVLHVFAVLFRFPCFTLARNNVKCVISCRIQNSRVKFKPEMNILVILKTWHFVEWKMAREIQTEQ